MEAIEIMFEHGVGASAKAIMGRQLKKEDKTDYRTDYPRDLGDFMRCLGVVKAFDIDITIMNDASPIWSEIAKKWDKLVKMAENNEEQKMYLFFSGLTQKYLLNSTNK